MDEAPTTAKYGVVVVVVVLVMVVVVEEVVVVVDAVPATRRPDTPVPPSPFSPPSQGYTPHISHGKGCRMRAFRFQIEQLIPRYYPEVSIGLELEERLGRDTGNCGEGIRKEKRGG
ncbi:hypothetical protein E2C01_013383 [Portunus trituberculatus]|uniref:Uncharacterized protein n=1 Tax=Portunus trituberculatus TaxID=210409 RepID=A0A5B7DGH7_PORTR|nr:hypothetical protein [Portunus trituberculatus]